MCWGSNQMSSLTNFWRVTKAKRNIIQLSIFTIQIELDAALKANHNVELQKDWISAIQLAVEK